MARSLGEGLEQALLLAWVTLSLLLSPGTLGERAGHFTYLEGVLGKARGQLCPSWPDSTSPSQSG